VEDLQLGQHHVGTLSTGVRGAVIGYGAGVRAAAGWEDLVHSSDVEPGIRRRRAGKRWQYIDPSGSRITNPDTIARIDALAIPPAWTGVWICANPNGHVQATGRDQRGRKQYRYHPLFRARREELKFGDLIPFGESLGGLRRRVEADLLLPGLPEERVLALVITLLDRTRMRVGNEDYAQTNRTFGLTTLRDRHVKFAPNGMQFCFVGKGGRKHDICLDDPKLAKLVRRCRDLPGQVLFQWEDDAGVSHPIGSSRVNDRIRELSGLEATAKTFRTWGATVRAAQLLAAEPPPASQRAATSTVLGAVDEVAAELGNTRTVARTSYVHPAVPAAYEAGKLADWWSDGPTRAAAGLTPEERRLLAVLRKARRAGLGSAPATRVRSARAA
jgi:DNA topoisomerase I